MIYLNLNFDYNRKSYIARAEKMYVPPLSSNNYKKTIEYRIFSFHPNDLGLKSLSLIANREKHIFLDSGFHPDLNDLSLALSDSIIQACKAANLSVFE